MIFERLVSAETRFLELDSPLELEGGDTLEGVRVAYRTWGTPRAEAILICHALSGSADADDWWPGLFGPGRPFDPALDFIVSSNVLGGCYGTTGPTSTMPGRDLPWSADFPRVTIRDMVQAQARLLDALGVERLKLVVGGSMGAMQVLEWALLYPDRVRSIAPLCVSGRHSAWCIGLSEAQRQAIRADRRFNGGYYPLDRGPDDGMAAARMMAVASYRSWASFEERFGRALRDDEAHAPFQIESYLRYQGEKLVGRFDANTYIRLTEAMDSHDVARGRGDYHAVLAAIEQPALVVGVSTDVLYPVREQQELAEHLPNARLEILESPHGHDSFLIEMEAVGRLLRGFLDERDQRPRRAAARG